MTPIPPLTLHIAVDHPAFAGHFPGDPLLPGVALLAEVIEAVLADAKLRAAVGPRPRIGVAKFLAPVRPGATLLLTVLNAGGRVRFDVREGERLAASGQFESASAAAAA
jgi:3-hydroxyacyl-[acyl-carrier-protein] dehydratase